MAITKNARPSDQLRNDFFPKVVARVDEAHRAATHATLEQFAGVLDATVESVTKALETPFSLSPAGRELLIKREIDDAAAMLRVSNRAATEHARSVRLPQLSQELATLPSVAPDLAREHRDVLRAMPRDERNRLVSQAHNGHLAAAVVHGARAGFDLVSDDALGRVVENFNKHNRPELVAEHQRVSEFVATMDEVEALVLRRLHELK